MLSLEAMSHYGITLQGSVFQAISLNVKWWSRVNVEVFICHLKSNDFITVTLAQSVSFTMQMFSFRIVMLVKCHYMTLQKKATCVICKA